jgi:cell division transport system permease protein
VIVHTYYFREAARSFRQHRGLAYAAIVVLTAALALTGVFLLLTYNAQNALALMGDRREMIVYLKDEVTDADRERIMAKLQELYGTVTYITKAQAWEEMRQQVGDPSLLDAVQDNPLPASLRIRLKPALLEPDAMDAAARQVASFSEVEDVRYGAEWVRRLNELSTGLRIGTLVIGIIVALSVVFVLHNTIRLTVLARRHQVEVMSRLGATDSFIAWPFVLEAMFEAALSAFLALAAVFAIQQGIASRVFGIDFLPPLWAAAFMASAVALAWFAAWLALSRVMRSIGP